MTAIDAWPFLIARGRTSGFKLVAIPRFLHDEGDDAVLVDATARGTSEQARVAWRVAQDSRERRLVVAYWTRQVSARDIGQARPGMLLDEHGRAIKLTEGVVIVNQAAAVQLSQAQLDQIHQLLLTEYERFWDADPDRFSPALTAPVRLITGPAVEGPRYAPPSEATPPRAKPAPTKRRRWPRRLWFVVALVILLLAAFLGLLFTELGTPRGPSEPSTSVRIRSLSDLSSPGPQPRDQLSDLAAI